MKSKTQKKKKHILPVFNPKDYESNDGMLTTVWGPPMWHYLHTMSFNYPVKPTTQNKKYYRKAILNLQYTLPCGKCRENLKKNLKELPLTMKTMKNRTTFSQYVFNLHELVNKMLQKTSGLTYEIVRERYEHFRSRCMQDKKEGPKTRKKEKGCTEPLTGEKSKCILNIVPRSTVCETFKMDDKCRKVKIAQEE